MRLLICGSRNWVDEPKMYVAVGEAIDEYGTPEFIVEGCAKGADQMAERVALDYGIPLIHFPANWGRYGKAAGPVRNRQMLVETSPTVVLAFHKDNSKGTQHMIDIATAAGLIVKVIK